MLLLIRFLESRLILSCVLVVAVGWSVTNINWHEPLIHTGGVASLLKLLESFITPDLSPSFVIIALNATWQTIVYATAGMSLAIPLGLSFGILASGILVRSSPLRRTIMVSTRILLAAIRSVHELLWALLFVAAIGLSPMAGILALGISYGGILGRIYADIINDLPPAPLRSLQSSGASEWQVFLYGRLPLALPDILSYTFYRLECAVRAAAILGFIGLGGLGLQIQVSLYDLHFNEAWTLLYFLVGMIAIVDIWSSALRRSLTK